MLCQAFKVGRPPATRRFGSLQVDLVGSLPKSEGCKYLLTMVDRFSRWPKAFPLPDMASTKCSKAFVRQWLPRFGILDKIIMDRSPQFLEGALIDLMETLGINTKSTTAYHPQCNGLVERMHRQLKASIWTKLSDGSG